MRLRPRLSTARHTLAGLLFGLCLTTPIWAGDISLPLTVRYEVMDRSLIQQWEPQAGRTTTLLQEGPCRYLTTEQPRLDHRDGQSRFVLQLAASLGVDMFGKCHDAASFSGSIELKLQPYIDPDWQLRFRVVDSTLYDKQGKKAPVLGFMWDLSKRYIHPRLETLSYDLSAPREEILGLLRASVSGDAAQRFEGVLGTLRLGEAREIEGGIEVPMQLTLPVEWEQPLPPRPAPPKLDEATLAAYQARMEKWDAFLVFIIKGAGLDIQDSDTRQRLLDLLIDSRYRLLDILANDQPASQIDPVRSLFVEVWNTLRDVLLEAERRGLLRDQLLRYMMFINAGDALLALDASAPGLGIEISADGLRRLAHTLRPAVTEDPLHYDQNVDPELREVFSFGAEPAATPLPAEEMQETPIEATPTEDTAPVPTPEATPDGAPQPQPELPVESPKEAPAAGPQSWLRDMLDWLITPVAASADAPKAMALSQRLHRWVPKRQELPTYQPLVQELLDHTANETLQGSGLNPTQAGIFLNLLPATAMIESCWRQYTIKDKKVTYLRSPVGSVGMLQINQNVWRGFYNVERLRWDVAYNSQAGAQILLQYMTRYGIKTAARTGKSEDIARATYAAYNAGPGAAGRFLKQENRHKHIDDRLWRLYQGLAAGGQIDLGECKVKTL